MLSSLLRATEDNGRGSGSVIFHGMLIFRAAKRCAPVKGNRVGRYVEV